MNSFGRVLVCFATGAEAAPFRRVARVLRGTTILITGIGPNNARAALQRSFEQQRPDLVISAGFAGGLRPGLMRGSIVFDTASTEVARHLDSGDATRSRFHTDTRIATTAVEKAALFAKTQADAVEMESGALRSVCDREDVAFAIVRVISDAAGENLPMDFNRVMNAAQEMSYLRLAGALIVSPGKIAELRAFKRRIDPCAQRQATALATLIVQLRAGG